MKSTKIIALLLVLVMCFSVLASCGDKNKGDDDNKGNGGTTTVVPEGDKNDPEYVPGPGKKDGKEYTYNKYLTISPSNWNELTYQDNNDTEVLGWIQGSLFNYDFKFDEFGEIIPGEFEIEYSAATKLEDVSATVDAKWGVPAGAKSYAYKITLREDIKWEDGTPIKAEDFVYSMKEQLNPLFQNYRADSYYTGATIIVNAQNYVKQGQAGYFSATTAYGVYSESLDSQLIFSLAAPSEAIPAECYMRTTMGFPASYNAAACAAYLIGNYGAGMPAFTAEAAAAMEGKTLAEIKADPTLAAAWADLIGWWQTMPDEELDFFVTYYTYPEMSFDEVGLYAASDYELVLVLAKPLELLKEDGSLDYKAAYNMSSLPLVNKDLYESCKVAPTEGNDLWTSNYCSSTATTMSWGPYKLESFQTDAQFTLVRNDFWYGYNMMENDGLYETTRIVYDIIGDWNSAWVAFQAGQLDGIGIDVSIAEDYKNSSQAFFTPSDFVSSLQLQSSKEALAARQEAGINKTILSYTAFRKALSLAIDRAAFTAECTTSSKAGFGLYNSMHYHDVANGGVYRNTDEAKKVLCEIYAVDYTQYPTLDDAVAAITGYDINAARALVTEAYNAALAAGDINANDIVKLTFGSGAINESVTRQYEFIADAWKELVVGTPLEGKLEVELVDRGTTWANDFRGGAYDVCMGGWTGAAWDPGYFLLAYLSPDYMYSAAWDTSSAEMTFTMQGIEGHPANGLELTMSLMDWYLCLNGDTDMPYDFSSAALEESQRLQLIAALEKEVLKVYYTVPLANSFSAALISYKVDYVTYEYNTFMGYGGVKYMTYNFDDVAWAEAVAAENGQLDYTR